MVPVFADLDLFGRDTCGKIFENESNRRFESLLPLGRHRELRAPTSYQRHLSGPDLEIEMNRVSDHQWHFNNLGCSISRPNAGDSYLHPGQLLDALIVDLRLPNDSYREWLSGRFAFAFQGDRGLYLTLFY